MNDPNTPTRPTGDSLDDKLKKVQKLNQIRSDTDYLTGKISEKMKYLDKVCSGCKGSGLAPAILGMQDRCVLCFGTGKELEIKRSFKP